MVRIVCFLVISTLLAGHTLFAAQPLVKFDLWSMDNSSLEVTEAPESWLEERDADDVRQPKRVSKKTKKRKISARTMQALESSMVPGVTCPLVDGREHTDLLQAAESLAKSLGPVVECTKEADGSSLSKLTKELVSGGKQLHTMIGNSGEIASSKEKQEAFTNEVQSFVKTFQQVTNVLSQSSLLNTDCDSDKLKSRGILAAVGDVVEAATPYVLSAVSANPALSSLTPFVLGLSGAGSAVQVLQSLQSRDSIDMANDPRSRMAVLQNVCEYYRIAKRTRAYSLAKLGDNAGISDQFSKLNDIRQTAMAKIPQSAMQAMSSQMDYTTAMTAVADSVSSSGVELANIRSQITNGSNKLISCSTARVLVESAGKRSSIVGKILENSRNLKRQGSVPVELLALHDAEKSIRQKIVAQSGRNTDSGIETCAQDAKTYVETLGQMMTVQTRTARDIQAEKVAEMSKNEEMRDYLAVEKVIQSEEIRSQLIAKMAQHDRGVNGNNVLDDAEIDIRLRQIKKALFRAKRGPVTEPMNFLTATSPAMAWLKFNEDELSGAYKRFKGNLNNLLIEVGYYGLRPRKMGKDGKMYTDQDIPVTAAMIANANWYRDTLMPLNLSLMPEGSDANKRMCRKLSDLWISWDATWNYMASQTLFCETISEVSDADFEYPLIKKCQNTMNMLGEVTRKSDLNIERENLISAALPHMDNVIAKINELRCLK